MSRLLDHQEKDKVRAARANFFGQQKRKLSTSRDAQLDGTHSGPEEDQPDAMSSGKRFKFPGITSSKSTNPISETPLIISFYDPDVQAKDAHGRSMEDIIAWPDRQLESCHNYIQMLFPVPEGSAFNWEAPIIDREVMDTFRGNQELRAQLRRSFERMIDFYGFAVKAQSKVEEEDIVAEKKDDREATAEDKTEVETKEPEKGISEDTETTKTTDADSKIKETEPHSSSEPSQIDDYSIERGPKWPRNSRNWAVRFDHNHLRITRILRCLRVLGLQVECEAFFAALRDVFEDPGIRISERSMMYWRRAVTLPLYIAPDDDRIGWLKEWEDEQRKKESGAEA